MSTGTNKRTILLNNYNILREDPMSYPDEIKAIILQLCEEDPEAAIKCWSDILRDNIEMLKADMGGHRFLYESFGYTFSEKFEYEIVEDRVFRFAAEEFAKDTFLLRVLYEYSPLNEDYLSVHYPLAYLIRNDRIDNTGNILNALYKNNTFTKYAGLWGDIVKELEYDGNDHYSGGGALDYDCRQSAAVQGFCMSWVNRIPDERERAGAMSHIMKIF